MLKILFRTGMILLAAGLIVGGLFLYANNAGSGQAGIPGGGERPQMVSSASAGTEVAANSENSERHGGAEGGGGLASLLGQLLKIGVITGIVVSIQALIRKIQRRHPSAEAL